MILCGGRGTRLREQTEAMPKALVEIGGRPILWHVIQIYAAQGFDRFLLATGYMGEMIERVRRRRALAGRGRGRVRRHRPRHADRRAHRALGDAARRRDVLRHLRRRRRRRRPRGAARLPPRARRAGDDDRRSAEPAVGGRRARRRTGSTGFVEKPRSEHWINGGFFCFEPGVFDYLGEDSVLEREPLAAACRRRAAARLPARGLLGLHGHLQGRRRPQRPLGRRRGAVADLGRGRGRGAVKRSLVTGGHGFVASHLARALLERGDAVTSSTCAPRAALAASALQGIDAEVELVEGDLRDAERVGAAIAPASSTRLPPRRPDPGRRRRWPTRPTTFEANVRGTWKLLEACRRAEVPAVVVASSDKAYGPSDELPYREDMPLRPASPYEASKAAADAIALSYCARLRAAGRGHPLRQHLRRRRPQLLAPGPRGGGRGARRPPPGDPLRRQPRARLPLRRRRGRRLPGDRAARSAPAARRAGRRSTPAASEPHSVAEVLETDRRGRRRRRRARIRGTGNPAGEIDRQYVDSAKLRELTGWRPEVELARRARPHARVVPRAPGAARGARRLGCAMCGRFTVTTKDTKKVADRFQVELEKALERNAAGEAPPPSQGAGEEDRRRASGASTSPRPRRSSRSAPRPIPRRPSRASARRG